MAKSRGRSGSSGGSTRTSKLSGDYVSRKWKDATVYLGIVGALAGAVVGVHQMWPVVEPYALATRGFVIEFVGDVQKPIQQQLQSSNEILRDIQIEAFEGKLDANKDAVAKWSLEKDKAADPNTKNMIDQHIKELVSSGDRLKGQLDNLRMLKAKAH